MKATMISIKPQWVEKILSGEKTIEVRKTKPKLETPFKCYIYCTKQGKVFFHGGIGEKQVLFRNPDTNKIKFDYAFELMCCENKYTENNFLSGKVVGEFVCDWIEEFVPTQKGIMFKRFSSLHDTGLSLDEIKQYSNGKNVFGWHISELKVYDVPKELKEFETPCTCTGEYEGSTYSDCLFCDKAGDSDYGIIACDRKVKRPPQSWVYVEEI